MAKFYRPKLNSWLTTLVLASIGLHGLVLALPMPNLVEPPPEELEELPDPEVIQVVTLPKLASAPESPEPPVPEPPPQEEPPPVEEPVAEVALLNPEILDEVEPEFIEEDLDTSEFSDDSNPDNDLGLPDNTDAQGDENNPDLTLDQRIASRNSYSDFDATRMGDSVATNQLSEIFTQTGNFPSPLRSLESELSAIVVPLQDCLDNRPGDSVSIVAVEVGADGLLMTGDPELINSTGYGKVLDEKALEIAR